MSNRRDRLATRAMERRGLAGDWGDWRITRLPTGVPGAKGWTRDVREVWANNLYTGHEGHHQWILLESADLIEADAERTDVA
jgi:hypothetical protein